MGAPRRWTINEAVEKCEELCDLIDEGLEDLDNDDGICFLEDVREHLTSMIDSLMKGQQRGFSSPTPRQQSAISNWESGVRSWLQKD